MDGELTERIEERLAAAGALSPRARQLIRAAAAGEQSLAGVLADPAAVDQPLSAPDHAASERPGAYLAKVAVEGFRGIGSRAELRLDPRPGLTVVVGRNGSGKSSFAEGLELLMTGAVRRWESKPKAWTEAWQCLHHDGPTRLEASFAVTGSDQPQTLRASWPHGATWGDEASRADADAVLADHGWGNALTTFRPFLAYSELATMFEKLSSLYEALAPVLGLSELDQLTAVLGAERLTRDKAAKAQREATKALRAEFEHHDDLRVAEVLGAFGAKGNHEAVAAVLAQQTDTPSPQTATIRALAGLQVPEQDAIDQALDRHLNAQQRLEQIQDVDSDRLDDLARLLTHAVDHVAAHALTDCPVCGTAGAVAADWALDARRQIALAESRTFDLRGALGEARAAAHALEQVLRDAVATAADHVSADSDAAAAFSAYREDPRSAPVIRVARDQLVALKGGATAQLAALDAAWQPIRLQVAGWVDDARTIAAGAADLTALKAAEAWMKEAGEELRDARFAPIADAAKANWDQLRHESSVELHDIRLKRVGRGGRADFDVRADGAPASALGVMSQGELLSLSVSIFLPRAALPESPFRFAVIDDPVQSMDPAKVDGLARVLAAAATTRQVIVFTHDDRLPQAIRRLRINATILRVDRQASSTVSVRRSPPPMLRYLSDAEAMLKSNVDDEEIARRTVPAFCRMAVEAACVQVAHRAAVRAGEPPEWVEEQLRDTHRLRAQLAFALFLDAEREGDVNQRLAQLGATNPGTVVSALNAGSHGGPLAIPAPQLPAATKQLLHALVA